MKYLRIVTVNIIIAFILFVAALSYIYYNTIKGMNDFFNAKLPNQREYIVKDSLAMFVHKTNIQIYDNWGTSQQKLSTERRTNNLGFREDKDIVDKVDNELRILVTGDSHTDGVLKHNYQSFVNIWEEKQNAKDSLKHYNFINGGTTFYSFRNYLGFLKKYKNLKPDVYFINVFTGNDFRETPIYEDNRKNLRNVYRTSFMRVSRKFFSKEMKDIPHAQGLGQTIYFKNFPNAKEESLFIAKKYMTEIKMICDSEDIKLVVTLLPSKLETNLEFRDKIKSLFDFSEEDLKANESITNEFISWLNQEEIPNWNLLKPLKGTKEKVYWDADLHINPLGHSLVADYLFEENIIDDIYK